MSLVAFNVSLLIPTAVKSHLFTPLGVFAVKTETGDLVKLPSMRALNETEAAFAFFGSGVNVETTH